MPLMSVCKLLVITVKCQCPDIKSFVKDEEMLVPVLC